MTGIKRPCNFLPSTLFSLLIRVGKVSLWIATDSTLASLLRYFCISHSCLYNQLPWERGWQDWTKLNSEQSFSSNLLYQSNSTTNTNRIKGKIIFLFLGMTTTTGIAESFTSFHPPQWGRRISFWKTFTTVMVWARKQEMLRHGSQLLFCTETRSDCAWFSFLNHFREDLPLSKGLWS